MIPRPAQYLVRFDDLCPTTPRSRWERFRQLVDEFGIRPILGIVPDNRDPELERAPADPEFWAGMRALEAAGATIAVHGYQHLCESRGQSLLDLHGRSEFAGVEYSTQREWIEAGFRILREEGLDPRLWIAPRHGFDKSTLRALRDAGVQFISDGHARVPHRRHGITWIPQQLWRPAVMKKGLWTICIHPAFARSSEADRLREFLELYGDRITSFDRVVKEYRARPLPLWEWTYEQISLRRTRRRHRKQRSR